MGYITPTEAQLHAIQGLDHEGPIHMLNLLRFAPETGRARYEEYMRAVTPLLAGVGGRLFAAASPRVTLVGPPDEAWDEAFIIEYPSKAAFFQMVTSAEYRAITHLRGEALVDSRLVCMTPVER